MSSVSSIKNGFTNPIHVQEKEKEEVKLPVKKQELAKPKKEEPAKPLKEEPEEWAEESENPSQNQDIMALPEIDMEDE
jgi:hypothetical protein